MTIGQYSVIYVLSLIHIYNEGELVGETLKFPTTTEEVQGLLKRIGVRCV